LGRATGTRIVVPSRARARGYQQLSRAFLGYGAALAVEATTHPPAQVPLIQLAHENREASGPQGMAERIDWLRKSAFNWAGMLLLRFLSTHCMVAE
jgi:hypothetical protein